MSAPMSPVVRSRLRRTVQAGADVACNFGAVIAAGLLVEGSLRVPGLLLVAALAAVLGLVIGCALGLYSARWRAFTFDEVVPLTVVVALLGLGIVMVAAMRSGGELVRVALVAVPLALVLDSTTRFVRRLRVQGLRRPSRRAARTIVFGAGDVGARIVTTLMSDPSSDLLPVALLDDDPVKGRVRVRGVRVVGDRSAIGDVTARYGAAVLVIAVTAMDRANLNEVFDLAVACGLRVLIVPSLREPGNPSGERPAVRDIDPSDLIGRAAIDTKVGAIREHYRNKTILITGAGGSIGSELTRQISRLGVARVVMVDRDESALHAVELSIRGTALLDSADLVLADLRDRERIRQILTDVRPDIVFHAAALKHLTFLERYPQEAWKTNVVGTADLIDVCATVGVARFVNISTDKAADPVSVLGYTKRATEHLVAGADVGSDRAYLSVRFGNVFGSRGSGIETFVRQIDAGLPVTVTDPDVNRYFMTIAEAVELVLQAAVLGRTGDVLVLDMGEPVRIVDLVTRLARLRGREPQIVYTGLRPGEKVSEVLFGVNEAALDRPHPLITRVSVAGVALECVVRDVKGEAEARRLAQDLASPPADVGLAR